MEGRMFSLIVLFHVAHGSSFGKGRSPGFLSGRENPTAGHVAVNPLFTEEPDDKFVLPNTPASLICEAKFVSKLKFNCSGKLVPREVLNYEFIDDNVTFLLAEISQSQIKNRTSVFLCNCVATGYNGQVIRSRAASVQRAYLDEDFVISPSTNTRVQKNSLLTLRCKPPVGNPSPAVSWWKDGQSVDTHNNKRLLVKSDTNSSLVIIRKAKLSDSGDYSCVASNLVGRRESAIVKLNVYVDGGWSEWAEFGPCDAPKCGNGTKTFKRICSNPEPENGGQFCTGISVKYEKCQDVCPDLEIMCPDDISVYNNRSAEESKNVSWEKPLVRNKKNDTTFSVEVFPQWAEPPVILPEERPVYVIKYVVKNQFGQTASCSFNITVSDDSSSAHGTSNVPVTNEPPGATPTTIKSGVPVPYLSVGLASGMLLLVLLFMANYMYRRRKLSQKSAATKHYEGVKAESELELNVVTRSASYAESAVESRKLKVESPTDSEVFDFPVPVSYWKEPPKTMHVEVEITDQRKAEKPRDYKRTNSSISNKSTVSEISRMMWNLSNLPENADPKMVAWGLVDHNGGKFTIGNTGVSLTVPPLAIPEGHTEGIYIAIVDQEKEHPQITSKESLLSPVVKCGPTGLKFQRPVILSMPHCALNEEGTWNLKVQYNESEPSTAADWKQLIDVNRQDGSEPSHVVVESNMVHLMVDHFTYFALTGESAANKQAPKDVQVLAYVTPPEVNGDCVVRVYCVGGTPAAVEDVHNQEIKKYRGESIDAPKQLRFKDGGGDLIVELKSLRSGWTSEDDVNKIPFRDIWEGIQRMPNCTFVFSLSNTSVAHFRAKFKVRQDCEDGEEQDVNVVTSVKQRPRENSDSSREATDHSNSNLSCACEHSASLPKAVSSPCLVDHPTALVNAGSLAKLWQRSQADVPGACGGNAGASPVSLKQMSSGYFSVGFESLPTAHSLRRELRSKLSLILDPPHENDWKVLAENIGLSYTDIRWIESRIAFSPTEILFDLWETTDSLKLQYPLQKMADILKKMERDDAVEIIEAQLHTRKETTV